MTTPAWAEGRAGPPGSPAGADPGPAAPVGPARPIVQLTDVIRVFRSGSVETIALRGVDMAVQPGEFVAVMGRSGSGKSTLLNLIAGSDRPTAGRVVVAGIDLARADEPERAALRGRRVGIVYQSANLVPFLSVRENVLLAAELGGRPLTSAGTDGLLGPLGLAGLANRRPARLSGGEQQRAALACVLAPQPRLLLGDEITGELDRASAATLLDALAGARALTGLTVILVTHDADVAGRADRILRLRDGRVEQ